ncbi:MAG: PIG-L deacetylase family protein [Oscillospiraceae bacterium]
MIRNILRVFTALIVLLACLTVAAYAQEAQYGDAAVETVGVDAPGRICDGSRATYSGTTGAAEVTVSRSGGIGALYIEFDCPPQEWTLTDPESGKSVTCGQYAFLHEFVDVSALWGGLLETLVLRFEAGTAIAEIYVFSDGELPDWVQTWQPPCEAADLLLISSHSDDEQLFFAGVLPYYTVERGLNVQVAYVVQHFQAYNQRDHQRPHEQLDGLWTVGVRNYPVMSEFPDLYSESKDRATALARARAVYENAGYTYDDFVRYFTRYIRRFQPLVVVSHDLNGEYGHGTHVLCAAALTDALVCAADPQQDPDSAAAYGPWTVEKTYLHLYPENQIVLDLDTPLESLGGKTAFQVTQEGFACHKSQHWTWFYKWIYGTDANPIRKAADIKSYSPCSYGLYDTKVGPDAVGGDFFENVETYAQRAQAAREEAEALAREEAERAKAEAERIEAERAEAERVRAEAEAAAEAAAAEQAETAARVRLAAVLLAAAICAVVVLLFVVRGRRRSSSGR